MAGARTRSFATPSSAPQIYGERGRWLEVIDGGAYGFKNKLTLWAVDQDNAVTGEQDVPCVAGTIVVADFEQIQLATVGADTVLVRIGAGPPPPPITGKQRVRWLARGTGVAITNGAAATALDLTGTPLDNFDSTRERFEPLSWYGWIFSTKTFVVYATARANPETPTGDLIVQKFATNAMGALSPGVTGTTGNVCRLDDSSGLAGPSPAAPFLPNTVKLWIANTDVASGSFSYLIGVRG